MTWGAVAVVGAAVVGGVASNSAAKKGAAAQGKATDAAIGEQQRQYDQTRDDQRGYRDAGSYALNRLTGQVSQSEGNFDADAYLRDNPDVAADPYWAGNAYQHYVNYGRGENRDFEYNSQAQEQLARGGVGEIDRATTPEEVMSDPGYKFGLQQGQQALDRKIAAMGGRVSGAALKAAARYGTDYGASGYNAAYQRGQDRLNRLASLAGVGQSATQASSAAGAQSTNAISGLISSQGDANAAAGIAQGNIWRSTGNQLAGYFQNRQSQNTNPFGNAAGYYSSTMNPDYSSYADPQ